VLELLVASKKLIPYFSETLESLEPISIFHPIASKATVIIFAQDSEHVIAGHESGQITFYHAKSGEEVVLNQHAHRDIVTDIQMAPDRSYFITSSKDKSAKVCGNGVSPIRGGSHTFNSSS
jgi:translation initiation factor 3 subunit I